MSHMLVVLVVTQFPDYFYISEDPGKRSLMDIDHNGAARGKVREWGKIVIYFLDLVSWRIMKGYLSIQPFLPILYGLD